PPPVTDKSIRPGWLACAARNRSWSHASGHRLHPQRERCAEAAFAARGAPIVAEAHHDEIVRWNDQGPLPARSRHVVRLLGHREAAVAVDPEEGAIDWTLVGFP